jgi:hypothetical protein
MDASTIAVIIAITTLCSGVVVALVNRKPGTIAAQGERIDLLWARQDKLEKRIEGLTRQADADRVVRNRLHDTVVHLRVICGQLINFIKAPGTDLEALAPPARAHVLDGVPLPDVDEYP